MPEIGASPLASFDYALVRVVPRVERGEFLNVGAIVFCRTRRYLAAQVELDRRRLAALAPALDPAIVVPFLERIPVFAAGGAAGLLGSLTMAERFHWLVAPRSTIVQCSPVHCGLCADPAVALERLIATMVRL